MKNIKDYFGTKTAIKCENEQQWNKLKELCRDRLYNKGWVFSKNHCYFDLEARIGLSIRNNFDFLGENYQILPYSDFVSDVPELVGVEMEVSYNGKDWWIEPVYGKCKGWFITENNNCKHARPITKKVLTATLQELAEMLNVDEIQLK